MSVLSKSISIALLLTLAACNRNPEPAADAAKPGTPAATPAAPAETSGTQTPDAAQTTVQQTKPMPTLKLATVDGTQYDLAEHRGKWVVVNFWATWCAPCLKEMPELSALHAMRGNVEVVGLAYEDTDKAEMQAFLKQHPVTYPIAQLDPYAPPQDFETPRGLPTSYLIDPAGKVAKQFVGPVTAKDIEAAIAAAGGKS